MKFKVFVFLMVLVLVVLLVLVVKVDLFVLFVVVIVDQVIIFKLVYGLLFDSCYVYCLCVLDEVIFKDVFKCYLEMLDGVKQYFIQVDVVCFVFFEVNIFLVICGGEFELVFQVFVVYKQCVGECVVFVCKLFKQELDFIIDECFEYDCKKVLWVVSSVELDELWCKLVKNDWLCLKLVGKKLDDICKMLDKCYVMLEKLVNELKGEDVFQFFMNLYISVVDLYIDYFILCMVENFNQVMLLLLEGIGVQLQCQDDVVVICEIIVGGLVVVDGMLKLGDCIVGVGQGKFGQVEDVIGWCIDDVVVKICGVKDIQVKLEFILVVEGVDGKYYMLVLIWQKVCLVEQVVKGEIMIILVVNGELVWKIGVIKLLIFYQDFEGCCCNVVDYVLVICDVVKLLVGFKNDKLDGVVLDLCNNGGGLFDEVIELIGLFIEQGLVVQVCEFGGCVIVNSDCNQGVVWDGLLVVLINRGLVLVLEIFVGVIQDYGCGLVIGEISFGKGIVQNIVDFDCWLSGEIQCFGQVKLIIVQFFCISGSSIQYKGVVLDLVFLVSVDVIEFGESIYDNVLLWICIVVVLYIQYGNFVLLLLKLEICYDVCIVIDKEFQWWNEDVEQFCVEVVKKYILFNEVICCVECECQDVQCKECQLQCKELGLVLDLLVDDSSDDGLIGNECDIVKDVVCEKVVEKCLDLLLCELVLILVDVVNLLVNDCLLLVQVLLQFIGVGCWVD